MAEVEPFKNFKDLKSVLDFWHNRGKHWMMWSAWGAYSVGTCSRWCETELMTIEQICKDMKKVNKFVKKPLGKKRSEQWMNTEMPDAMKPYIEDWIKYFKKKYSKLEGDNFLFSCSKSNIPHRYGSSYRVVKDTVKILGIKGNYGTHSFRHTGALFRYEAVKRLTNDENKAANAVKEKLAHEHIDCTFKYLRESLKIRNVHENDVFEGFENC